MGTIGSLIEDNMSDKSKKIKLKRDEFYDALIASYVADFQAARATLERYLNDPQAVGDHSDFIEDMKKQVAKMSAAQEALDTLKANFERS